MPPPFFSEYIKCVFNSVSPCEVRTPCEKLTIFYAETGSLVSRGKELINYISADEKSRADKFLFNEDRDTYIISHALVRLTLAFKLNAVASKMAYLKTINDKPYLAGFPVHFNLTHTKNAFAFVMSTDSYVGIDLEEINKNIHIPSIVKTFFSKNERDFIFSSEEGLEERFIKLWTRKEAFLKALGTGIGVDLPKIEVCDGINIIDKNCFSREITDSAFNEHFIYSDRIDNYFLSIAATHEVSTEFRQLNAENIDSFIDR